VGRLPQVRPDPDRKPQHRGGDPQGFDREVGGEGNTPATKKAKKDLEKTRGLLNDTTDAIDELQKLYEQTKRDFGKPSQRVIGHVVWSPAITIGTDLHSFTKDVCVIKLDKARFLSNFKGNVIDLGAY
jgi:hypothetical protein